MRSKLKIITFIFVILTIVLVPSCFAATVLENTEDYEQGAIIYGSTRFEMDQIVTAGVAFNAGINESKVWVALGNKLNELEPVTPYYYDGETWYELTSESAKEVEDANKIKEIEENLHIFFVNNEAKTIEVPYEGTVDNGSITEGVSYNSSSKKFEVPAYVFDFEFTTDGAEVRVETNVDTNIKEETEEVKQPEVINVDVATIGDVKFQGLPEAFEAAKSGDTIKLLADIDLATGIVVNKQVTLDLNGKTITAKNDPNGDGIFYVRAGGDLTINGDGTIDAACQTNNYSMAIWARETGKVTINGGTFTNNGAKKIDEDGEYNNNEVIYARENAVVTINGGTFIGNIENEGKGTSFTLNLKDEERDTAKIIVKGGTYTGFDPANNVAENAGTNFVAEGYKSVYDEATKTYTVKAYDANNVTTEAELRHFIANGGTIKLAADVKLETNTALAIKKDTVLDLNGKTLSVFEGYTKNNVMWTNANLTITGNGTIDARMTDKTYSYAVYAYNGGKVTIENGNFIGVYGLEDYPCSLIYCQGAGSLITILDGTFVGDAIYTLNLTDDDYRAGTANIIVKGGTYTGFDPANSEAEAPTANLLAEGYKSVYDETTNKYTVVAYDANNVTTEAELRYFIANGGTVKLGADIDLATGIVVNKQVTLDLNGKTITAKNDPNGDGIFYVRAGGDLTINGDGTIDAACQTNNYSMAIWARETGKVTINGGTFTNNGAKKIDEDGEYNNNEVIYARENAVVTINGGTFIGNIENEGKGTSFTLNLKDEERDTAKIIVKGGTYTGFDPANNVAENAGTNFVAEGYKSVYDEAAKTYTVVAE